MADYCVLKMGALLLWVPATRAGAQSENEDFRVVNRALLCQAAGVMRLDGAPGDGAAWLKNRVFTTGPISVEVQGADLERRSFVGIAFQRADDQTFEAVYLRPSQDAVRRSHSVQYASMPAYPWSLLREKHPGKYEAVLAAPVVADSWVRLTLTINAHEVRVLVNESAEPVLNIVRLSTIMSGGVGLWVGNESEGRFRKLVIEP